MPFNLRKLFFSISISACTGFLHSSNSLATVIVTPQNGGDLVQIVNTNTVYYNVNVPPGFPALTSNDFIDVPNVTNNGYHYQLVDVTKNQTTDSGQGQMLIFQFYSNTTQTIPQGQVAVIAATVSGASAGAGKTIYVPIAAQGTGFPPAKCGNGVPGCLDFDPNQNLYNYAAAYAPGTNLSIGIYPADICNAVSLQGGGTITSVCGNVSGVNTANPQTNTPAVFNLSFNLYLTSTNPNNSNQLIGPEQQAVLSPSSIKTLDTAAPLNLSFQSDSPVFTCPPANSLNTSWFPGDQSININTGVFSTAFSPPAGLDAPVSTLIAFGNVGAPPGNSPAVSQTYYNFPVAGQLPQSGGPQNLGGIANMTSQGDTSHQYGISLMMRSHSGVIAPPAAACNLTQVETSAIFGFLSKSNCFIATAAFRSMDAPPVEMLREFRDQFLLKSPTGTAFVHWYYHWSPPAAEWLIENSIFRYPILLALAPLELMAWLILHKFLFLVFAGFGGMILFTTILFSIKTHFEKKRGETG